MFASTLTIPSSLSLLSDTLFSWSVFIFASVPSFDKILVFSILACYPAISNMKLLLPHKLLAKTISIGFSPLLDEGTGFIRLCTGSFIIHDLLTNISYCHYYWIHILVTCDRYIKIWSLLPTGDYVGGGLNLTLFFFFLGLPTFRSCPKNQHIVFQIASLPNCLLPEHQFRVYHYSK